MTEPAHRPPPSVDARGASLGSTGQHGTVHVSFSRLRELKYGVVAGLVADVLTRNLPISVGLAAIAQIGAAIRKLSVPELEILWVIKGLSAGHVYTVWVDTDEIVADAGSNQSGDDVLRLLASMKSRGILERRRW